MAKSKEEPKAHIPWPETGESRTLPVILTQPEIAEKGRELAGVVSKLENLEAERKSAISAYKAQIDSLTERQKRLTTMINEGEEDREVECFWAFECCGLDDSGEEVFHGDRKTLIRRDTGKVVLTMPITEADRQMTLPDMGGSDDGEISDED